MLGYERSFMGKKSINEERAKYINSRLTLGKSYTCNDKKIKRVSLASGEALLAFEDDVTLPVSLGDLKKLHKKSKIILDI